MIMYTFTRLYAGFSVTADLGAQVTKISARLVCGIVHEVTVVCVG